ncbi:MAG: FtsX-like permease family protein [Candidatus Dormibacteraeota bacterium]|uniref:FtsX-like permease family protein n=1 Tax=Candidatus Amunia macphersoniae TaxID=3127014 RepID=A0A934N8S2_9BACT|nr:FtsX-like permease family protein [Candidatus Dormibacteraeota bacterium]
MIGNLLFLLRHTGRSVWRGGRRTAVAVLCITVGVAAVVALQVAAATVSSALTSNVRASNGGDVAVSSQSSPLTAADLTVFTTLHADGRVSAVSAVARLHATASVSGGTIVPFEVNTVELATYPVAGDPPLVNPQGGSVHALMAHRGDVLVSSVLADQLGVGIGGHVFVNGIGGAGLSATVRGVLAQATLEHSSVMLVSTTDGGALTDAPPEYVSVYLGVPGASAPVAAELRSRFPQASVTTVDEALQSAQQQVHDFREYTLLTGLVTLLVAGVGIFNVMHSVLASRYLEIAMLKAIGYRPRSMFTVLALEAAVIGLAGGVVGTLVGLAVSGGITAAVARAVAIQAPLVIDAGTVALGVALGLGSTVVFALLPIVRAARLRPLSMLRPNSDAAFTSGAGATVLLLVVSALLFALLAGAIVGDLVAGFVLVVAAASLAGVFGGIFAAVTAAGARLRPLHNVTANRAVLAGLVLLTAATAFWLPAVAVAVGLVAIVWTVATVAPRNGRMRIGMATRSLDRRRARTAVTLVALLIGIFSMSLTVTVSIGLRDQLTTALARAGSANLLAVTGISGRDVLIRNAQALPGLQSSLITTVATAAPTAIDGKPLKAAPSDPTADPGETPYRGLNGVSGYDLAGGGAPAGIVARDGRLLSASDARSHNIILPTRFADPPASLHPGSTVTFQGGAGGHPVTMNVVGLYQRAPGYGSRNLVRLYGSDIYGDTSLATALGGGDASTVVTMAVDDASLVHDSVLLQRASPGALVINVNDLTAVVRGILNNLLIVLALIAGLTLLAGLTVVGNGVTLAMIERRQEIAMLKAIGFPPRSVTQMVLLENALAGLLAGAVSVIVVAVGLAALSRWVFTTQVGFSAGIAIAVLVIGALIAMLGAWLGSRRAVRLRPTEVLRNT